MRGLGVLEVDDEHVPAGPPGGVELLDQLPDPRDPSRVVGAHEDAVRAGIGDDGDALLAVGAGARRSARGGLGDQAVQQRDNVERGRVAERDDDGLAARRLIERGDDAVDALEIVGVVGDHERVGVWVRGDRVVWRDERSQHVDELRRGFVAQRHDLGDEPIAAGRHGAARNHAALLLCVGLRHDLHHALAFDGSESLQTKRGEQRRVDEAPGHGARGDDVDGAFDPGIDDEIAARDLGHGLYDGIDIGVDEIERDRLVGRGGEGRREGEKRRGDGKNQCPDSPGCARRTGRVA